MSHDSLCGSSLTCKFQCDVAHKVSDESNDSQEVDKINISQLKSLFKGNEQFGLNLAKNCDTFDLMICSIARIFLRHCLMLTLLSTYPAPLQHNVTRQIDISISQFSHKISFSGKRIIEAQFGPPLFNFISHDLSQRFFLKHLTMMGHSFPRNPFQCNWAI